MSEFVIFIHDGDEDTWKDKSEAEQQVVFDTDYEFGQLLEQRGGKITGGAALTHSSQARVRRRDQAVTEGPYAETVEVLNGFYIVQSPDLETLLELTEVLTRVHDVVEVRPVEQFD